MNKPVVYIAFVVPHSDSDVPYFGEIECWIKLVVVGGNPTYPHTGWLLPSKDPHRIVVLEGK